MVVPELFNKEISKWPLNLQTRYVVPENVAESINRIQHTNETFVNDGEKFLTDEIITRNGLYAMPEMDRGWFVGTEKEPVDEKKLFSQLLLQRPGSYHAGRID
jgi:hypothetical protein